jgi:arsenical pump membrane protein
VFVLALGIVVRAAGDHGLSHLITTLLPSGTGILDLWAIAGVSAIAANLLNNLPATLILLPVVAVIGPGAVLAMLVGVGIGPNLTYVGSLATLLWRRVLRAHDETSDTGDFVRLGLLTVPAGVLASTAALWLALQL